MIPFRNISEKPVSPETMEAVYQKIKTLCKQGVILSFSEEMCDSPTVFRFQDKWYMSFIKISKQTSDSGYDSHIAESDDLLHWQYAGQTMRRNNSDQWDSRQIALYAAYIDNDLYGDYELNSVNGSYHFAYLGGNLNGYETDPLMIGQCKTSNPLDACAYQKLPCPRLQPTDPDARPGETLTLYKSNVFIDPALTTGYRYVNAYNAKAADHKEQIFLAVSEDGENWQRYGDCAILADDTPNRRQLINGDPQILKLDDLYIMLYFVLEDGKTYDTFACSYDLIHWTKWHGKPLVESTAEYDCVYAHKPCLVVHDDIVYHFYCAVDQHNNRTIALSTSNPL